MSLHVAWSFGEQDEGVASNNASVLGSTPFQSSQFTTYFKVLKATHQLMAPGNTHVHRNIKGFTIYTMMVISGTPVDNTAGTVSTSDARIDYFLRKSYRFLSMLAFSNVLTTANNLPVLTQATYTYSYIY